MEQATVKLLFALLRSAVGGDLLSKEERALYSDTCLQKLTALAQRHDVAHLLAYGMIKNGLCNNNGGANEEIMKAAYRTELVSSELDSICSILEEMKIPFIPLKGAFMRDCYPEPWMRTSCDIDILVRGEDIEGVTDALIKQYGYEYRGRDTRVISMNTANKVHLELHCRLAELDTSVKAAKVLESVWNKAFLRSGYTYWHEMSDDMFYFYHIAHMAKHFEYGGCGIKPFIDLYILDAREGADIGAENELLERGKLLEFAEAVRRLCKIWFCAYEHDALTRQAEEYILRGGVFGTEANYKSVQQQKKDEGLKYLLSKIFIPYHDIKFHYPILEKHKWLLPVMEVRRWGKLIFCGHIRRVANDLQNSNGTTADETERIKSLFEFMGL